MYVAVAVVTGGPVKGVVGLGFFLVLGVSSWSVAWIFEVVDWENEEIRAAFDRDDFEFEGVNCVGLGV